MNDAAPASSKSPSLAPLRAIYRAARAGAAVDPQALVAAIGYAVAHGADVFEAKRAFEPYAFIRLDCLGGADGAYMVRAALETGGWRAALRMASLLGWTDVWAAAMTAYYGHTGIHESRLGPDGRPSAATLAEFPRIGEEMAEAAERCRRILANRETHPRYATTRWEHVVTPRSVPVAA